MTKKIDIIGKKYNQLTVIASAPNRSKRIYWLCECSCGNTKELPSANLKSNKIISCGCHKQRAIIKDLGRECTVCHKFLPWEDFNKATALNAPNKKASRCRNCVHKIAKAKVIQEQQAKGITELGRICKHCNTFKDWQNFPKLKSKKNNIYPKFCKSCQKKKEKVIAAKAKKENWFHWKAGNLRSTWGVRIRKDPSRTRAELPERCEIENWLRKQLPFTCYIENIPLDRDTMQVDHKHPTSRGGSFDLTNLGLTSKAANQIKGNMLEQEFKDLVKLILTWEDKGASLIKMLKQSKFIWTKRK